MSYDVHFKAKLDGCDKYVYVGDSYNYTCNLGKAIREANKNHLGIPDFNNKSVKFVLPIIKEVICEFINNTQKYRQYEPDNGWGTIETCIEFLMNIKNECEEYPTALIEVCY